VVDTFIIIVLADAVTVTVTVADADAEAITMHDDTSMLSSVHKAVNCDGCKVRRRIVTTCMEMLVDRGCTIVSECEDTLSSHNDTFPIVRGRSAHTYIEVFLHAADKVGVKYMRQILNRASSDVDRRGVQQQHDCRDCDDGAIVCARACVKECSASGNQSSEKSRSSLSSGANDDGIAAHSTLGLEQHIIVISIAGPTPFTRKEFERSNVQFFLARDMCYNPTRHSLVPRHEVTSSLPDGVSKDELPRMLLSERIVQYYNWPVGTIVHVHRVFGGHEPVSYFRVVSHN